MKIRTSTGDADLTTIELDGASYCIDARIAARAENALRVVPPGYEWDEGTDDLDLHGDVFKLQTTTGYGVGRTYRLRPVQQYKGTINREFFRCTGLGAFTRGAIADVVVLAGQSTAVIPVRLGGDPQPADIIAARFAGLQEGWVMR